MKNLLLIFTLLTLTLPLFALNAVDKALVGQTNLLENPGFESGIGSYTASSSSTANIVTGTSALFGNSSLSFDATTTGQYIDTPLMTIPAGMQGTNCLARMSYKGGDNLLEFQIVDNSATILASRKLMASAVKKMMPLKFTCPSTGSVKLRLISSGNAAVVTYDELSLSRDESKQDDTTAFYADAENAEAYIAAYSGSGAVPDLTFGTPSGNLTAGYTTTGPLDLSSSYVLNKTVASSTQGQGWYIPFSIPESFKAKAVSLSFEYSVASGTFVAGSDTTDSDVKFYIYDVTNGKRIDPDTSKLTSNSSTLSFTYSSGFQTAYNSTNYYIVAHNATTSANQYSLKIDKIKIGSKLSASGPISIAAKSYTPTLTNGTNTTIYPHWYSRDGEFLSIQGKIEWAGAGSGTTLLVSLPTGLTVNTSKLATTTASVGSGYFYKNSSGFKSVSVRVGTSTSLQFTHQDINGFINGSDGAAGYAIDYVVTKIPIVGWESTSQQSEGFAGRPVYLFTRKTSGNHTSSGNFQDVAAWDTNAAVDVDTLASFNKTTGVYTFQKAAVVKVSTCLAYAVIATNSRAAQILYDGVIISRSADLPASSTSYVQACASGVINAQAGKTVRVQGRQDTGGSMAYAPDPTQTYFMIEEQTSGQTISATAKTVATYKTLSSTSIVSGTALKFTTSVEDSHGRYNPSTGAYVIETPGTYEFILSGINAGAATDVKMFNGAADLGVVGSLSSGTGRQSIVIQYPLVAGDSITFVPQASNSATDTVGWFSVKLVK